MRTRIHQHRGLPTALALALVGIVVGCSDDAPQPGKKIERISIEPDFRKLEAAGTDQGLPNERRYSSIVNSDDREAHELKLGSEIALPLPAGERACEVSLAALAPRDESRNAPVAVDLWVEEDGARRLLIQKHFDLVSLREHWLPIGLDFGHPIVPRAHLVVRASSENAQPLPPGTRLFLDDPVRTGDGDKRPNLLIISVDTLRPDHLHCFGSTRETSPNIDALAARGVLFEEAQSSAPWTMASYGAFFTSRSPTVNRSGVQPSRASLFASGGRVDPNAPTELPEALAPDLPVLAEILRDQGWATAGFHFNPFLNASTGLLRGFQRWVYYRWCADTGVDLALDWIGRRKGAPWFAFVHMIDPHQPYSAPPPFDRKYAGSSIQDVPGYPPNLNKLRTEGAPPAMRRFLEDEYDGEIAWTDAQIGRLLDVLEKSGELDNTLIVFHSDHGEEFWDHDSYEHGHTVYQELLHVPLIFVFKGKVPAGVRIHERVGLIDVMPTLLEMLQVDVPKTLEGVSLVPIFQGKKLPQREFLSEGLLYGDREMKALVVGNDKVIVSSGEKPMLFDLAADPHELHDLAPTQKGRADAMRDKLMRRAKTLAAQAHESRVREFSESEQAELTGLGYTQGQKAVVAPSGKNAPKPGALTAWFGVSPEASADKKGVLVGSTSAGTPAERAGLVKGDILLQLGDAKLGNVDDLLSALQKSKPGDVVLVKYVRNGKEQETTVTLPARAAQ